MERTMIFEIKNALELVEGTANEFAMREGMKEAVIRYRTRVSMAYPLLSKAVEAIEVDGVKVQVAVSVLKKNIEEYGHGELTVVPTSDGKSVMLFPDVNSEFGYENFCKIHSLDKNSESVNVFYSDFITGKITNGLY